jgi:hypothetical protein
MLFDSTFVLSAALRNICGCFLVSYGQDIMLVILVLLLLGKAWFLLRLAKALAPLSVTAAAAAMPYLGCIHLSLLLFFDEMGGCATLLGGSCPCGLTLAQRVLIMGASDLPAAWHM